LIKESDKFTLSTSKDLEKFQRVVSDQNICIGCGSCVATCPYSAWELDEKGKSRLIWEKCQDAFDCVPVCPVSCIYKSSEATNEAKDQTGWYRFDKELTEEEKKIFIEQNKKHGIKV
jgi:ferredoxin